MRRCVVFLTAISLASWLFGQTDNQREVYIGGNATGLTVGVVPNNGTNSEVRLVNANGNDVGIDLATRSMQTISYEHHEIHSGSHYVVTLTDTDLDTGETNGILVTTANSTKWAHMLFAADSSVAANGFIVENPTVSTTGATITAYNNDRNSTNTAVTGFTELTYANGGTTIDKQLFGAAAVGNFRGSGGAGGRDNELILKQNEEYAIYLVGAADNGRLTIHLTFYEHTNKTD